MILLAPALVLGTPAVCADGSVTIVGSPALRPVAELFAGPCVTIALDGSDDGLNALTAGAGHIALMDRGAWEQERRPFRVTYGREAVAVRIGYFGLSGRAAANPPAVYVHRDNPVASLTLDQVTRIFTRGAGSGDIVRWGQAGMTGTWADRRIHLYGARDNGGSATNTRIARFAGRQYAEHYEPLASDAAALGAVADDRYGIAIVEAADRRAAAGTRMLPLSTGPGRRAALPDAMAVRRGDYPLAPEVLLYLNPGAPGFASARALAIRILSPVGQAALGRTRGMTALSPADAARELKRLGG